MAVSIILWHLLANLSVLVKYLKRVERIKTLLLQAGRRLVRSLLTKCDTAYRV